MNPEKQKQLRARWPLIISEDASIECGDGWYVLIDTLCNRLQYWADHNSKEPQIVATQIKEKFGQLRFYTTGKISLAQFGMIEMAAGFSAVTCEQCGQPGELKNRGGWLATRCEVHQTAKP